MAKGKPSEFAVNMYLTKMSILQQGDLKELQSSNYFDAESPCHIYFIGRRPRLTIDKNSLIVRDDHFQIDFKVHYPDRVENLPLKFTMMYEPPFEIKSEYPYTRFEFYSNGTSITQAKVSPFIQSTIRNLRGIDFLDFEVLYIGQSFGVDGARTAPDRLVSHSTLQSIYAEAISNNPESEIWLALASFSQVNIVALDGRTPFSAEELEIDDSRMKETFQTLQTGGISEQQKINFTEAALIKYFEPLYNKTYKDSFPNPAHKTYSECYDLDINTIGIEMNTYEMINCMFYTDKVERQPWNMHVFPIHSPAERKAMFDFV